MFVALNGAQKIALRVVRVLAAHANGFGVGQLATGAGRAWRRSGI